MELFVIYRFVFIKLFVVGRINKYSCHQFVFLFHAISRYWVDLVFVPSNHKYIYIYYNVLLKFQRIRIGGGQLCSRHLNDVFGGGVSGIDGG